MTEHCLPTPLSDRLNLKRRNIPVRKCAPAGLKPLFSTTDPTPLQIQSAQAVCDGATSGRACPLKALCLQQAVATSDTGIFAGIPLVEGRRPPATNKLGRDLRTRFDALMETPVAKRSSIVAERDAAYASAIKTAEAVSPRQLAYSAHA